MRSLLDIRMSRWALALLAAISGAATAIILIDGRDRTPAQVAALVALRSTPAHAAPAAASVAASAGTATASTPAPAPSASSSFGSGGSGSAGGGSSSPAPAPSSSAPAPSSQPVPAATASTPAVPTPHHATATAAPDLPRIGHVFEIMVSTKRGTAAFGRRSPIPYLHSLQARGTLLSGYRTLGDGELADELALISGQAPNPDTADGCPRYVDFPTSATPSAAGVLRGRGCVYPETVLTIGDQVTAAGKTWDAYVEDMGKQSCVHPNSDAVDDVTLPFADPGYDTRHNPFIYFHSLLDLGDCSSDDVDLGHLPRALRSAHATPTFSYVAPGACADADPTVVAATGTTSTTSTTASSTTTSPSSSTTTTNAAAPTTSTPTTTTSTSSAGATTGASTAGPAGCPASDPDGPAAENAFLRAWIPKILASAAYRRNGMLIIAVSRSGPGTGRPSRTGALVLSPLAHRGRRVGGVTGPFSLLRLGEDALRLKRLAHAASAPSIAARVLVGAH